MHLSFDTREGGREGGEIDKTHCFGGEYLAMKEETITLGSGKEASSILEIRRLLILYGEIRNPFLHDGFGPIIVVLAWDLHLDLPLQHCMHEGRLHVVKMLTTVASENEQ